MASWLVVGHGSVGSFLTARLVRAGADVAVLDPSPRVPVIAATRIGSVAGRTFDHAVSCVPPAAAEDVAPAAAAALRPGGLLLDWNTVAPAVKRRLAATAAAPLVDVALLDSLDGASDRPTVAVSGARAEQGAALLAGLGFTVTVAGSDVGDAAALKYLRSIFMKTLEALALEFSAVAVELDRSRIVRDSIARNLGERFVEFMDLLIATNRVHAERRRSELADAVATFGADGAETELAAAAVEVLRQAAAAWQEPDAPPVGAAVGELTRHLHRALGREPASA